MSSNLGNKIASLELMRVAKESGFTYLELIKVIAEYRAFPAFQEIIEQYAIEDIVYEQAEQSRRNRDYLRDLKDSRKPYVGPRFVIRRPRGSNRS